MDADVKIIIFVCMMISFFLVLCMLLDTLTNLYCPNILQKESYAKPIKYYQITSILSFTLGQGCIICDCIHVMISFKSSMPLLDSYFLPLRIVSNSFAFNSYMFTYLVIFGRLYLCFKYSRYELSSTSLYFIILLFVLIFCGEIMYIVSLIILQQISRLSEYLVLFLLIIALSLSMTILLLFSKKVLQLLRPQTDDFQQERIKKASQTNLLRAAALSFSENNLCRKSQADLLRQQSSGDFVDEFDLNEIQIRLLSIAAKNTVIVGIATFYFVLRFSYRQFPYKYDKEANLGEVLWLIGYFSRSFMFVTNGISVYFGFSFSDQFYHQVFGSCHLCIFKCCARMAKRKIANDVLEQLAGEMLSEIEISQQSNFALLREFNPGYSAMTTIADTKQIV